MADALASREQRIRELTRFEARISRHILEPFHSIARRALQLESLQAPFGLIGSQPGLDIGRLGDPAHERHGILHGQLGAGSDAEMRRVRRIADQHDVPMMPLRAQHPVEIQPRGAAQMIRIAHQSVSAQVPGEQRFAEGDRLLGAVAVQAVRSPGLLASLDDDRGELIAELVGMDLEPAVLGFLEGERKGGEFLVRAQPNEAALADGYIRLEYRRMLRSGLAVHAIGGDDEIGIGERRQVVDFGLKVLLHAQRSGSLLKDVEQPAPADAAEAMTARSDGLAPEMHLDIVPVMKIPVDRIVRPWIRRLETRHGLVRENDPPAEGIVGPIALVTPRLSLRAAPSSAGLRRTARPDRRL